MEPSVIDILEEIEATSGKNAKRDILDRHKHNKLLKRVFRDVGDPYRTYGISKFKMPAPGEDKRNETYNHEDVMVSTFMSILDFLADRVLTGNAAREKVVEIFAEMSAREQKWAMRMLLKKLNCGASEGSVEATWPGLIPKFEVARAHTLATSFDADGKLVIDTKLKFHVAVEPKLDGLRCLAVKRGRAVTVYKRSGNLYEGIPTIVEELTNLMPPDTVFDGEVLDASGKFQETTKKKDTDANLSFHVFDMLPLKEWDTKEFVLTFEERRVNLEKWHAQFGVACGKVKLLASNRAAIMEELLSLYSKALDDGHEGVMVKLLDWVYTPDKSKGVWKLKPTKTWEGTVIGSYKGGRGTKREGLFGGFYVLFENGVVTKVGGGMSDAMKAAIELEGPDTYNGRVAEVEGQPDPFHDEGFTADGCVRFPVFLRWREANDVAANVNEAYARYLQKAMEEV